MCAFDRRKEKSHIVNNGQEIKRKKKKWDKRLRSNEKRIAGVAKIALHFQLLSSICHQFSPSFLNPLHQMLDVWSLEPH